MKSLNVEIHPDKTWLGRVKNGFEFLGFRMSPTTIQPSTESVSHRGSLQTKKVALINEQGANTKRIGQYLRRWLGWASLSVLILGSGTAYGMPNPGANACTIQTSQIGPSALSIVLTTPNDITTASHDYSAFPLYIVSSADLCITATPPDNDDGLCEGDSSVGLNQPSYYLNWTSSDGQCLYEINVNENGITNASVTIERSLPSAPTSVPIFTPLGLAATISGLLWFGRRRRSIK